MIREKELELLETLKLANTMNLKRLRNLQANQIYGEIEGKEIKIKGASNGNCELEGIAGDMKQDVRQGYNKLIYPFIDSTKTNNGVTFSDLGNGIIVANGTASADAYFNLSRPTLQSGTYLYTIDVIGSTTTFYAKFGTQIITNKATLNISEEFTPTESYLCVKKGTSVNNLIFKPMLIEGTIEKSFEQYGVMPSLDFPSDVEGVETYNILPLKDMEETNYNGLKISIKDNTITINGTSTKSINIKNILKEDIVLNKGEYYLQYVTENTANINSGGLYFSDSSNSTIIITNFWNSNNKLLSVNNAQIISSSNSNLFSNANQTYNNTKQKIMLVKKKTRDIFLPYGVIQNKIQNKNYYNVNDISLSSSNITVDNEDYISFESNNISSTNYLWKNFFTTKSKTLKPNTKYYLMLEVKEVKGTGTLHVISRSVNDISQFQEDIILKFEELTNNYKKSFEITTLSDLSLTEIKSMLRTFGEFNPGQSGSIKFRISILSEEVIASNFVYTSYQNQIYQLSLGDKVLYGDDNSRDYFKVTIDEDLYNKTGYKKIDELRIVRNWHKYTVTGNENFVFQINNRFQLSTDAAGIPKCFNSKTANTVSDIYCNMATKATPNQTYDNTIIDCISCSITGSFIYISLAGYSDLQLFKQKLQELNTAGNPLYIIYRLLTPTEEVITDSLLISQIEEMINNIEVYDEETNISSDCYLKLKYCKSLQKYIENKIKEVSLNE